MREAGCSVGRDAGARTGVIARSRGPRSYDRGMADSAGGHVAVTRRLWDEHMSAWFERYARSRWAAAEPYWGMWCIPQSRLPVLPVGLADVAAVELGCGSGYVSAWLARRGARPVGGGRLGPAAGRRTAPAGRVRAAPHSPAWHLRQRVPAVHAAPRGMDPAPGQVRPDGRKHDRSSGAARRYQQRLPRASRRLGQTLAGRGGLVRPPLIRRIGRRQETSRTGRESDQRQIRAFAWRCLRVCGVVGESAFHANGEPQLAEVSRCTQTGVASK